MTLQASTYTYDDAIGLAQNLVHGAPVTAIQVKACDIINSMIWTFYPWSWTIASLTPITLVDGVQDYTPTDANILRPLKMRIVRTDITPQEYREIGLMANLAPELSRRGGLETNTSFGWYASGPFFRFMYAMGVAAPQVLQLQGEYQMMPTRVLDGQTSLTMPFPDYFFNTFYEGLLWKFYQLTDDNRAGSVQFSKNGATNRVFTGQFGIFMESLMMMARTEDLKLGDQFEFPETPLGVGRNYWPGLFGL